jgi:hypothetical protein
VLNTKIYSADGTKHGATVSDQCGLYVQQISAPPLLPQKMELFRQYLTTDGTASGSNDMGVDGSSTNVDFYVEASPTVDRYLTNLSFIVGYGTSGQPFQWADGTALSNGTRLFYTSDRGEKDIHDGMKSNEDVFRLTFDRLDANWQVRGVGSSNDYGYFITCHLDQFVPPYGIKLDKGSKQRLTARIRDNAGTDADLFNCIAYGFDRFV